MSELALARQIAGEIVERNTEPALRFALVRGGEPGIFGSKVGGTPYLPRDMAWPLDSKRVGMELLAQVDCAGLEGLPDFPHRGLLQFFFGLDDVFGMDFDDPTAQKGFRVLYHETVDPTVTAAEVLAKKAEAPKPEGDARYYTPLFGVYGIRFAPAEVQRINSQDFRAWDQFLAKWNELHGTDIKTQWDYYRATKINGEFPPSKEKAPYHQMGGYPYFTQEDPRINAGELANLDVLLFQLDSDMLTKEQGGGDMVLWGDCGVCNFFINREALKKRDFSRVCYNWDCC
ncbi:MAG: DUF1963 domain-containing protein [Oscillospiraceae bacterium]|jgi:uncharacterized protein YwqG|nr:DUF1963 domain-containing protein [Oscillospiraceae bacterium]